MSTRTHRSASQLSQAEARVSALFASSWHGKALLVAVVLVAAAGAVYWFRSPLSELYSSTRDTYTSSQDEILSRLGLGVVPVAFWLAAFSFALARRREWFRYGNLWASSVAVVALSVGIMAFFEPYKGFLAIFTMDGEVTLGGDVGRAIIGSSAWLGFLRLLGIFIAGAAVAAPPLAAEAALALGKVGLYAYVLLVLAVKGAAHMLPFGRDPGRQQGPASHTEARPGYGMPPEVLSPYARTGAIRDAREDKSVDWRTTGGRPAFLTEEPASAARSGSRGALVMDPEEDRSDDDATMLEDMVATDDADEMMAGPTAVAERTKGGRLPVGGKFNDLWDSFESDADGESDVHNGVVDTSGLLDRIEEEEEEPADWGAPPAAQEWAQPTLDILTDGEEGGVTEEEMQGTAETIRRTLGEYNVEVEIGQVRPGPTVTMYGLIPGWIRRHKQVRHKDESGQPKLDESGKPLVTQVETKTRVKVDSILSREKDLALALKTPSIRIETPVMGKSQLGIEVPNPHPSLVTLRSVMESEEFARLRISADLPVALGKGSGGETIVVDLAKMPHLLIAGATGSGKERLHQRDHIVSPHGEKPRGGATAVDGPEAGRAHAL